MHKFAAVFAITLIWWSAAEARPAPGAPAPAAQATSAPEPRLMWRVHTENLAADRALVRACLTAHEGSCERIVQEPCLARYSEDERMPALERQCDWRAMAAWEDEMEATLSRLRGRLGVDAAGELDAAQRAWQTIMLEDVGLGMDTVAGGSLAGPIGAHIRAREEARRTEDLEEVARFYDAE